MITPVSLNDESGNFGTEFTFGMDDNNVMHDDILLGFDVHEEIVESCEGPNNL